MPNKDAFSGLHPAVSLLYFALVIGFSMFFTHPVCLAVSLGCSVGYCVSLMGWKRARKTLGFALPAMLLAAVINPAFNHKGATILAYLPSGNPLTLESMLYGLAAAALLAAVLIWFACYTEAMSSDKFVYLFGRVIPALSLVLSMTLRFVPKFSKQLRRVSEAQSGLGRGTDYGSIRQRTKNAVRILSIMVTWSLENAIETADSMKSRGYGLPGRTAFSIYRFEERDGWMLAWLLFAGGFVLFGSLAGGVHWRWFPSVKGTWYGVMTPCLFAVYLALCLTPMIFNAASRRAWRKGAGACSGA